MEIKFHKEIDAFEELEHVKELAKYGPRYSTSQNEEKAISYIEEKLKVNGTLKVSLQKTKSIVNWKEKDSRLRIISPIEEEIICRAILGCS